MRTLSFSFSVPSIDFNTQCVISSLPLASFRSEKVNKGSERHQVCCWTTRLF